MRHRDAGKIGEARRVLDRVIVKRDNWKRFYESEQKCRNCE